jgi:hypothetical protein
MIFAVSIGSGRPSVFASHIIFTGRFIFTGTVITSRIGISCFIITNQYITAEIGYSGKNGTPR